MRKRKAGLHKKISSIFDGVPLPEDGAEQPTGAPAGVEAGYVVPAQPAAEPVAPAAEHSDSMPEAADSALEAAVGVSEPEEQMLQETVVGPKPSGILRMPGERMRKADSRRMLEAEIGMTTAEQGSSLQAWARIRDKLFTPKKGSRSARQKTMAMLVPALIIALFVVLGRVLMKSPAGTAPPAVVEPMSGQPVAALTNIDWELPEPYPTTLRDPMQAAFVATVGPQPETDRKLNVRGIVYSQDNPSAVVGAQIVHEGDEVSGAIVIKINRNSVDFEKDGKRWTQEVEH